MSAEDLRIEDLTVSYFGRRSPAVRGVSLKVREGEFHGLVGESGSGKSTIARSVLGLTNRGGRVLGGRVFVGGRDVFGLSAGQARKLRGPTVAYIGQNPFGALHPVLRIDRQFELMRRAHRGVLTGADGRTRALELLSQVGISDPASVIRSYVHQLSGGMAQRIVIALAMFLEPGLIVADEPTTGLDVTIQRQILDLLTSQARAHRTGLLLVTHDLGVVAQYCDSVSVLYGGQVMEAGPVATVLTAAKHPYTKTLLAAIPVRGAPLVRTRADSHPIVDTGCPFRQRCPSAVLVCETAPPTLDITADWRVRCHLATSEV